MNPNTFDMNMTSGIVRVTSTAPPEAFAVIVLCGNCKKRVPPENCNVPIYHLGQSVYFCSEECKKVWEIEKRKEGIRVIKIKKRR
jgi:YHS domain-containing protein